MGGGISKQLPASERRATLLRVPRLSGPGSYPLPHHPFGIARVRGDSMLPTLRAGDRLLVRYAAPAVAGRLVLARFADGTLAVKRPPSAARPAPVTRAGGCSATTRTTGVDSRHRGPVARRRRARRRAGPGVAAPTQPSVDPSATRPTAGAATAVRQ